MKTYRTGFLLALVGNIVLIGVLAAFWWLLPDWQNCGKRIIQTGKRRAQCVSKFPCGSSRTRRNTVGACAAFSAEIAEHRSEDQRSRT